MRRQQKIHFIVLGIIGFTFTITAASYCLSVLRGVRPQETLTEKSHPLRDNGCVWDRPLAGQLIILAIATVGAVAVDHVNGQKKLVFVTQNIQLIITILKLNHLWKRNGREQGCQAHYGSP